MVCVPVFRQQAWIYDRPEQPVSMSGANTAGFVYDAHRRRVRQVIDGETIYSVYTSSGSMVYRHNATTGETTDYLRLGSRTVARLDQAGKVTYTYADHLGSPVLATNASGGVRWREDYTPFGEARPQSAANDNGESYTGHITDTETGIVYMQARYYDPAIGRFLSQDPVGFASGGVGYFNRYAYVGNDPLNATDPTGAVIAPNKAGATDPSTIENELAANPSLSDLSDNHGGNQDRYFFTEDYGWVDVRHFGAAADAV
jgi:RHS repeat-associated protein